MGKFSEGMLNDDVILQHLSIRNGDCIVDAGCGNGYMAKKFSVLVGGFGKVYAIDLDTSSISRLKGEVGISNVETMVGDVTCSTGLKDGSIDLIYLSTVFHIFSKTQIAGFLKETKRTLKKNGRLAVVNIHKIDTSFGPPKEMRWSPEELTGIISLRPELLVDVGDPFYMQTFVNI